MGLEQYKSDDIYREAERRLAQEASENESLTIISMEDVIEENIEWLYHPYIPRGKVTLCAAYPGVGKTYMLCYIAACVSKGKQLFDMIPFCNEPQNVVYLTTEDGLGDTIKKRLRYCNADMKKIFSIDGSTSSITFDSPQIENIIRQTLPALMIFDPFQSYIGENVELNAANKTRAKLDNIVNLAEKYNVAIVLICHFNKNQKGDAITRVIGSTDIVGLCRSYLALGNVPEEEGLKYMSHEKSSLAKRGETILFEIDPERGGIRYVGTSQKTMDDYSKQSIGLKKQHAPVLEEAVEFLKTQMPEGQRLVSEIKNLAAANGFSDRTIDRAKNKLGIKSKKIGYPGEWFWVISSESS